MGTTLEQILLFNIVAITTSCNSKCKKVITFVFLNYCFNKYHFYDKLHLWGWQTREPIPMYMLGPWPSPRKNSSSARQGQGQRGRSAIESDTPDHSMEEDKYWERKWQRKAWKYLRENCYYCIKCSATNWTLHFNLYNHSQRL